MRPWAVELCQLQLTMSLSNEHRIIFIHREYYIFFLRAVFPSAEIQINMLTPMTMMEVEKNYECFNRSAKRTIRFEICIWFGFLSISAWNASQAQADRLWWENFLCKDKTKTKLICNACNLQIEFTENTNKKSSITVFILCLSASLKIIRCNKTKNLLRQSEGNLNGNIHTKKKRQCIPLLWNRWVFACLMFCVVKMVVVRVSFAAPEQPLMLWCNRTKWICNYFILSYINLLWFLLNLNTLPVNGMRIHVSAVLQSAVSVLFFFFFWLVSWMVGWCSVWRLLSAHNKSNSQKKKKTLKQAALQRHAIVIICYSIFRLFVVQMLEPIEKAHRLGWKLYGFDFDTVCFFIYYVVLFVFWLFFYLHKIPLNVMRWFFILGAQTQAQAPAIFSLFPSAFPMRSKYLGCYWNSFAFLFVFLLFVGCAKFSLNVLMWMEPFYASIRKEFVWK